ncbi:hypothetical protein [Acinetobacter nosocomialis]|uniref:hypothetical protein n=1 Tax=Acinetobacter nosocomialis TaxID=106654 RepID=UPI001121C64C|nr:hypothetical protein [Acinetobacter nosocomialis]
MTVPISDRLSQLYVGNGTNTRFDFTFRIFQQEDLTGVAVRKKGNTDFETVDPSTYTVTLNADDMGGFVKFNTAPSKGTYFYIAGATPLDQLLDITNYDNFYPDALERALDKLTALLQEWGTQLDLEKQARILADIHYDSLAMEREENLENRLISYINAVVGITNPKIFDGISDRMVITKDGRTQREFNESIPFWTNDYVGFKQDTYIREEKILEHSNTQDQLIKNSLNASITAESNRAKGVEQSLQLQISTSANGIKYFETEIELKAFIPSLETDPKQAYAFDTQKNYLWKDNSWKDEGKSAVNQGLENFSKINSLLNVNSIRQDSTFYTYDVELKIVKRSHNDLFAVQADIEENDYIILNTFSFGLAGAYYITDKNDTIIVKMESNEVVKQSYLIKAPANAAKIYVNCTYEYSPNFSISKIPSGVIDLIYEGKNRQQFTYYAGSVNEIVAKESNQGLFAIQYETRAGDLYLIDTKTFGNANEYCVVDQNDKILAIMRADDGTDAPYVLKIPEFGAKLYVNCAYTYSDKFSLQKLSNAMFVGSNIRTELSFYYSADGKTVKRENNPSLFNIEQDVLAGDNYSVTTGTFGIAGEYYIVDKDGNLLSYKPTSVKLSDEYIITIPEDGAKLYVNCAYTYADYFSVTKVSNTIIKKLSEADSSVRSVFPTFNYFDKLRVKCPNFYRKFKDKNQDVTVVLTGTSLTQGNLYASDRADATIRPAALHTNDLASSVFDKLIKHWDGQKYRRYDHDDIFYSNSSWSVTTQADDWDDHTYIKNGLTKTTTDANASVSTKIPANAWQFNFVYRTNTNGCDCKIEITQGVGYVEVFNGTNWVEAHNYQFSNLESAATVTKGNTQYQKRLKMRCKNKAGGVNSIGTEKQITIRKVSATGRFNVVGFEWSPREYMLFVINGARGGHEWGDPTGNRLDKWQDTDIWSFNPDLLLAEITIINWGASEATAMSVDPLHYVNIAKRAYFNEFNDMSTSLYAKSSGYTVCDVIFYSDTLAATSAVSGAWDSTTHEPLFGTVTTAASNGDLVDTSNVGRVKNNFENYEAVERYIASKDYLFIPVLSSFKYVAENYYGGYWQGMQASDKTGNTLSYDGVHFNDNGAALFSKIVASVFDAN